MVPGASLAPRLRAIITLPMTRHLILSMAAAAVCLGGSVMWLARGRAESSTAMTDTRTFEVTKTDAEWRAQLSQGQYYVLRKHGTETAGWSPLNDEHRPGTYACAGCGQPLFTSATKYDSRSGWPSFYAPLDDAVGTTTDASYGMTRIEVHCRRCGGHLGHVFDDGPEPTGLRYCMNGVALAFTPD